MAWAKAYLPTKWHLDPSNHEPQQTWAENWGGLCLHLTQSGRGWGLPPCQLHLDPSSCLDTHTNVTDRTQDRQRSESTAISALCLFDINIWLFICSDIFKFLSRLSHFSTFHDAEHATLTKDNTGQSFRNDHNGLHVHFLVELFCIEYPISFSIYSIFCKICS